MIQLKETKDCHGCNVWIQKYLLNVRMFRLYFNNNDEVVCVCMLKTEGLMAFLRIKIYRNFSNISTETSYEDVFLHNSTIEKSVNYHKDKFSTLDNGGYNLKTVIE